MALCLQGCKYTDVLTEHVEDDSLGTLDPTVTARYNETPDAPEDPQRSSNEVKDTDRVDLQEEEIPVYDEDAEENGTAIWREYDPESPYSGTAAKGTLATPEQELEQVSEEVDDNDSSEEQDAAEEDDSEEDEPTQESDGSDESDELEGEVSIATGSGGTGTVYDATGKTQKLPENCSKVAACGYYATIVQMLAGKGGLVACDDEWQDEVKERGLFSGEGVQALEVGWTAKSDGSYKIDVKAVIAAEPDAVLVDGVQFELTAKQQDKLQDANIDIITVPALGESGTADGDIVDAVNIVGELLKNSTTVYYSTQTMAAQYEQHHDATIEACVEANGGYTSKYIDGYSTSIIFQNGSDGVGISTSQLSSNRITTVLVDSWAPTVKDTITLDRGVYSNTLYLDGEEADSSDGVGLSASVENGSFALIDYYFQVSGVMNNAYESAKPAKGSDGYSVPVVVLAGGPINEDNDFISTSVAWTNRSSVSASALWYSPATLELGAEMYTVGDEGTFPGVVARTKSIAKKIVKSAAKVNGLYNVGQAYTVWVMPSGIDGSWSTGTAESYLASVWALKTIWSNSSVAEDCDAVVDAFYSTFYRCESGTEYVTDYTTSYTATCPTE